MNISRKEELRRDLIALEKKHPTTLISNHSTFPNPESCDCWSCMDRVKLRKEDPEYAEVVEQFNLDRANGNL
jgi:hypothetical protein